MRICIDLDGVISRLRGNDEGYADLAPVPGAAERIRELKSAGHVIIINTARRMKTCGGNPGKVIADVGLLTLEWLKKHDIPYDEIYFGKPWADIYIDDNGYRFETWDAISRDGMNLPVSKEVLLRGEHGR